jgi:hypothetical protein
MMSRNEQWTKTTAIALFAGAVSCAFVQSASAAETATFTEKVLWSFGSGTDGAVPLAGLIEVNGMLYGTTYYGGNGYAGGYNGTGFAINPNRGAEGVGY